MEKGNFGYAGKILRIDLGTGVCWNEPTKKYSRKWLGQRGIGQKILYDEVAPWVTPYEPANKLTIETGPLTGTLVPTSTRYSIASKNPFTGGVGTSNSCGFFGPELKFAGYDVIVIEGRANTPCYLWICDDTVELRSASHIWGKTTWVTEDIIRKELGDKGVQISCIGPAGERLVRGACVIANKNRACGKCGMGGIFGSKNLKAIAVRGTGCVKVADPGRFMKVVDIAFETIEKSKVLSRTAKYGTIGIMRSKNECNSMPYRNFQDTYMPTEVIDKIDADIFMDEYKVRDLAGMACPIHCSNFYRVNHGPYAGLATEGFQLNTVADYAAKCGIEYPPAIIKVHALCNQLGVDLDASAGAISWALECYEKGILTDKDTDGLRLEWGDHGVIFELIRKIVYREGFGNVLAEGCKRASQIVGKDSSYYAIHMKGQDLYEEIRSPLGWGLGTCVATRGGGHTTGASAADLTMPLDPKVAELGKKIFGIENIDPISYEDKAKLVVYFEREQELVNSLGVCMFAGTWLDPGSMGIPELAEIYSAATGLETTEIEMIEKADRILNLEKAFNSLHTDFGRKDDFPPERCLREGIKSGPHAGFALSEEEWGKMLDEYYELRGWRQETGFQTRKCLKSLDLEDVANSLEKVGKLENP